MTSQACADELKRMDADAELTKLLRHGYGSLTIKIHAHKISTIDSTSRHTHQSYDDHEN